MRLEKDESAVENLVREAICNDCKPLILLLFQNLQ